MLKSIFTTLIFSIISLLVHADSGNWIMYFGNNKLSKKINFHNEIQYRNYNAIGNLEQLLLRTGIGYDITENNNNILLGYAYVISEPKDKNIEYASIHENRIFQQFIAKQNIGRVSLNHRYRLEQRFIDNNPIQMRGRYMLNISIPINNNTFSPNTWIISAYNEIFINAKKNNHYDRNRIYGAVGYQIDKKMKIEVGYMSQILENRNSNQFQIGFYNNLDYYSN